MSDLLPTLERPYSELLDYFSALSPVRRILDLGCGSGRNALHLARLGHHVVAVDQDDSAIQQLESAARKKVLTVECHRSDFRNLPPFQQPFDLILLDRVLHYIETPDAQREVLARMVAALAPSGSLCAVFISTSDESYQVLSSFVSDTSSSHHWKATLNQSVTHSVPCTGSFTFHAVAWQLEPG